MYPFDYQRPSSVQAAVQASAGGRNGTYLAGGMTLLPALKLRLARPDRLVDLAALAELRGVRVARDAVEIGAMTRHAEVAGSDDLRRGLPALAELAGGIGDPLVRNRGTLGGSIANNDPAADYPAAVLGLGATVVTDQREIDADSFFTGMFATALRPGELVTRVRFPVPKRAAYAKFPNPASRYAMVGVFVAETARGVRVAVTGASSCVFRVASFEKALAGRFAPESLNGLQIDANGMNQDLHGTAEYRASLVNVMARRAVGEAAAR
jgi:carbon-monoxide dehydrogenase medium subunit